MQLVGCMITTAYTMLDLQIVPTTLAHNNGRKLAIHTRVNMLINGITTESTMDAVQVVLYID